MKKFLKYLPEIFKIATKTTKKFLSNYLDAWKLYVAENFCDVKNFRSIFVKVHLIQFKIILNSIQVMPSRFRGRDPEKGFHQVSCLIWRLDPNPVQQRVQSSHRIDSAWKQKVNFECLNPVSTVIQQVFWREPRLNFLLESVFMTFSGQYVTNLATNACQELTFYRKFNLLYLAFIEISKKAVYFMLESSINICCSVKN